MRPYFTDALGMNRLNAFSDGVFCVAVTLLVFELRLPVNDAGPLSAQLLALWPKALCYFVTFHLVGIYWMGHVGMCRHLKRYDRTFLILNSAFLMFIALMPFPTAVLGSRPDEQASVILYSICFLVTGLALALVWWWASHDRHLIGADISDEVIRVAYSRILLAPVLALVAIAISFFSCQLSIALYVIAGIAYTFPSRIDRIAGHHLGDG